MAQKHKGAGRYTPPDLHAQAEEGSVDRPQSGGEDYGVMSARVGSWTDLADPDRYTHTHTRSLCEQYISVAWAHIGTSLTALHTALLLVMTRCGRHSLLVLTT